MAPRRRLSAAAAALLVVLAAAAAPARAAAAPEAAGAAAARALLQAPDLGAPFWAGKFSTKTGLARTAQTVYVPPTANCARPGTNCAALTQTGSPLPPANLTYMYEQFIKDPTATGAGRPVVDRVWYPAGSYNPGGPVPGGAQAFLYPTKKKASDAAPLSASGAAFEYQVYFPANFDWALGGKLPGLVGGVGGGRKCAGAAPEAGVACFSFRVMWRQGGAGEAYLYIPPGANATELCTRYKKCALGRRPCSTCDDRYGLSIGKGTFTLVAGAWNTVRMEMVLNAVGAADGALRLSLNGVEALNFDSVTWRTSEATKIEGAFFGSFFGGSTAEWASPVQQYSLFRSLKLWVF